MKRVQTAVGPLYGWDQDDLTRAFERDPGLFWDAHLRPAIDATRTDGWAIDLGANIGFFTCYLAGRFQHVLAVEAHPVTCGLLRTNLAQYPLLRRAVSVVEGAAYDRHTTLELASSAVHGWIDPEQSFADLDQAQHVAGFTFVEDSAQQHHLHEWRVDTVIVDELLHGLGWLGLPVVRLIKIDVQGADLRALHGCDQTIARCRPRILFEYEGHVSQCRGDDWPDYERFFAERHYSLTSLPGPWSDWLAEPVEQQR